MSKEKNEVKEEVKAEVPKEEVKAEAPKEEVKAEAPKKEEVKAEATKEEAKAPVEEVKKEEPKPEVKKEEPKKVSATPEVTGKDETKYPPVQPGKKRVNVYANGINVSYVTYPFIGEKKAIVLDLEDIKKLCWHKVPVEEIKADGTLVKLTLENYDK